MTVILPANSISPQPPGGPYEGAADELALLRTENAELRALLAIQRDLSHGSTPKEVLQEVVGQVHAALGCDRTYALLWDRGSGRFTPAATAGLGNAAVTALKDFIPGTQPVSALEHALASEGPLAIVDASASELIPAEMARALGMGALLLVPVRDLARDAIGVLVADFDRPASGASPLTSSHIRVAVAVAAQLTLLLENAILYEQLRRRTLRLEALNEIGLVLAAGASGEPSALFARLQPQVADVVDGRCLLAILDEAQGQNRRELRLTIWATDDNGAIRAYPGVALGSDALSEVFRNGRRSHIPTAEAFGEQASLPAELAGSEANQTTESAIYLPLRMRRRTFGIFAVLSDKPYAYATEQIEFLTTVAAQTAVTLEHGRLYGLLRAKGELRRRLLDQTMQAQEAERKALVEGVLDGALQELASCSYRLDLCVRLSELGRYDRLNDELGQTRQQLAERIEDLRTLISSLRPSNLDILGLQSVLRDELTAFQQQTGVQTFFHGRFKDRLGGAVETRAYRIAQELLSNVRRHAQAKSVTVELRSMGDDVLLSVTDDGIGFNTDAVLRQNTGIGLHAVREGAEILGGSAHVQSRPGMGTRIEVLLPRAPRSRGGSGGGEA
ncbi:MAG: GAF domain-containing protein [Thermomicrobiales bacterium]